MNTDATRAHIDAETLAAWADRGLPADAAAAVELHLSNCERCQEVLAAFVRSTPAAGAVVLPFWARRPVQWSAAGLAAAAALVAIVWIGRPPAVPAPESTVVYREVAPTVPPAPTPVTIDQLQAKPSAAPSVSAPAERRRDKPASAREELRKERSDSAPQNRVVVTDQSAKKAEGRVVSLPPASVTAPPPAPPAAVAQVAPPPPPLTVTAAAPVVSPPASAILGGKPAVVSESVVMDAFAKTAPVIEIAAPAPPIGALRSTTGGAGRGGAEVSTGLSQSVGPTRWRIIAGTRIERTVDAGATWTALPIEPPLTTSLVAGVATSPLNCWLVGRDGVVLVTRDGQTFRRVSVPEVVHLTGVTATDDLHATVTAIDGRKFSTFDGGLTWK